MTTDDAAHEHLSLETAADFDERLLDGAASADVAARVASCATCADTLDAIHRTRSVLADLPAVPMPIAVADRLHAALAAEAQASRVPGGATTVTALTKPRRRLWLPIGAGIAAAGALVFALQLNGPSSTTAASSPAAAAAGSASAPYSVSANVRTLASGIDYKTTLRASVAGRLSGAPLVVTPADAAALEDKSADRSPVHSLGSASPAATASATAAATTAPRPSTSASDTGSVPFDLPTAAGGSSAAALEQAGGGVRLYAGNLAPEYGPLLDRATLDSCIARLVDPAAPVLPTVIDYASYAGKPALAIFFPSAVAGQLDVYVVGPACGTRDDLLTFLRVPAAP